MSQANAWVAADPKVHTVNQILYARIGSGVLIALGILFFCGVCYMRKEIQLAMGTVEETSKAISSMPLLIVLPVFQCLGTVIFLIIWVIYAVYIASLGKVETESISNPFNDLKISYRTYEFDRSATMYSCYHLFCLFWTTQFIVAIGSIMIANSVARWYFTRNKSTIGNSTVIAAVKQTLWYNSGTAAFGGLILAIVRAMRAILFKIQEGVKDSDSKAAEAIVCSCACCLWCLDNFLKFLNKNAYIQTAIFGTSFCESSTEAFYLVARNALKIGAMSYVTEALSILGRLFVTVLTSVLTYLLISHYIEDQLSSLLGPMFVVVILAYAVSDAFMDVFDMGSATVLQCFIADDEMFTEEESYAGGDLKRLIDDWDP